MRRLLPVLALCLTGCDLPYYWQAAAGQLDLIQRRQPITDLLAEDTTPATLRQQLQYVLDVRAFAHNELHLVTGNNYTHYADLERPHVVWNVFATQALSLKNERWCFPVAGCVPYRGYFTETDALAFAQSLAEQGLDTYVGGVPAYSTLGWFDDAVLNTFIGRDSLSLAGLLFHELAHQTVYIPDDATFNESFATAVENIGLERWIEAAGLQQLLPEYQQARQRQQQFLALVLHNRAQRETLFNSHQSDSEKHAGKARLQAQLLQDYQTLKQSWNGYGGYDRWFAGPLNNAQLSTVATYHQLEPGFRTLFEQSHRDFATFYHHCRTLGQKSREERHLLLNRLANGQIVYTAE